MSAVTSIAAPSMLLLLAVTARAQVPRLPCFRPDSGKIAYSRFDTASDGDVSGQEFSFAVQAGRLVGWRRHAAGEMGSEERLDSLRASPAGDSLFFTLRADAYSRHSYRVRVTCRAISGTAVLFRSATNPAGQTVQLRLRRARPVAGP